MSAIPADAIETVETPFARARAHAATVEDIVTSDEMIRKRHSDSIFGPISSRSWNANT